MKKIGVIARGLLALASFAASRPKDTAGNGPMERTDFIGVKTCRVEQNTGAVQCETNKTGILYWLCAFGTAAAIGTGGQAFDTVQAASIAGFNQAARYISPPVYGTAAAAGVSVPTVHGCWAPVHPVRFETGLAIKADSVTISVLAGYRLDSGTNP